MCRHSSAAGRPLSTTLRQSDAPCIPFFSTHNEDLGVISVQSRPFRFICRVPPRARIKRNADMDMRWPKREPDKSACTSSFKPIDTRIAPRHAFRCWDSRVCSGTLTQDPRLLLSGFAWLRKRSSRSRERTARKESAGLWASVSVRDRGDLIHFEHKCGSNFAAVRQMSWDQKSKTKHRDCHKIF